MMMMIQGKVITYFELELPRNLDHNMQNKQQTKSMIHHQKEMSHA